MKPEELLHINELRRRFLEEVEAFAGNEAAQDAGSFQDENPL